jgi:hypothetical protein
VYEKNFCGPIDPMSASRLTHRPHVVEPSSSPAIVNVPVSSPPLNTPLPVVSFKKNESRGGPGSSTIVEVVGPRLVEPIVVPASP